MPSSEFHILKFAIRSPMFAKESLACKIAGIAFLSAAGYPFLPARRLGDGMRNMNLKMKLGLGFGTVLAILAVLGLTTYNSLGNIQTQAHVVVNHVEKENLMHAIDVGLQEQLVGASSFLITKNETQLNHYREGNELFADSADKLEKTLVTDDGKKALADIRKFERQLHAQQERALQLRRSNREQAARETLFSVENDQIRAEMRSRIATLIDLEAKLNKQALDRQEAIQKRVEMTALILTTTGLLIGLGVTFLMARSVTRTISSMVSLIQEIAANNLSGEDMLITSQDEIGRAGAALNGMKKNLRGMIQSIAETAEHVASASEQISSSAAQQAQSADTQKDQASQVATAMQEMSATVQQVSENSNRAAEAARHAAETARHGGGTVDETLAKMRMIAAAVSGTAKKVEDLGKRSDEIGRIVGVIDDIADQTNLLALNAAIEAARAGEQGRGFAVVADEVRKLAERTTSATKEIAHMIKNIQDETRVAVTAMENGTRQVEEGVSSTAEAGKSLQQIIEMAGQVGEMITHIATAATEQSGASEQVNQNMDQIARLIQESAAGSQEAAKACQHLSGLALDLQKMVSDFKLGQGNTRGAAKQSPTNPVRAWAASAH